MYNDFNNETDRSLKKAKAHSKFDEFKKWIPSIIILPIALYWTFNPDDLGILRGANLIIHEGGHGVFMFFGKFLHILGGTLMQILIPSLIFFYFLQNNYRTGMQVSLLWLGHNFIDISIYVSDAQERALPLIGNLPKSSHDWWNLLQMFGILEYDNEVGYLFYGLAVIVFAIAVIMPLITHN